MWNKIVNPKTGRNVNVNSKIGKNILRNYIKQLGGSTSKPTINCTEDIYRILSDNLNNLQTTKIYISMHGGNFIFKHNLDVLVRRNRAYNHPLIKDMSELTFRMPDNLIFIHFYQLDLCGYSSTNFENTIINVLRNTKNWMVTYDDPPTDTDRISSDNYTLNETAHLFLPGDEVYNSLLAYDDDDENFDIFNINQDTMVKYEHRKTIKIKTMVQTSPSKSISMNDLFTRLSENVPDGEYRLIYLFNCDPLVSRKHLNDLEFTQIINKKKKIDVEGRRRWINFKTNCLPKTHMTREQTRLTKPTNTSSQWMGVNEFPIWISEITDPLKKDKEDKKQKKKFEKGAELSNKRYNMLDSVRRDAKQNIFKQTYGVTKSGKSCIEPCDYHGRNYYKGIIQSCFGNSCKFATKTCRTSNSKYEECDILNLKNQ